MWKCLQKITNMLTHTNKDTDSFNLYIQWKCESDHKEANITFGCTVFCGSCTSVTSQTFWPSGDGKTFLKQLRRSSWGVRTWWTWSWWFSPSLCLLEDATTSLQVCCSWQGFLLLLWKVDLRGSKSRRGWIELVFVFKTSSLFVGGLSVQRLSL